MSEESSTPSRDFVLRYYEGRREILTTTSVDAEPAHLFTQLAGAALPAFAQWVAVVEPSRASWFSRCVLGHEHARDTCAPHWSPGLDIDAAIDDVIAHGESLAWPGDADGPRGIISRLVVDEVPIGAVLFARDPQSTPWDENDLSVIHDVVTALGVDLERLQLRYQTRLALRSSQRVASQLHQLISASLAVSTLHDESEIVRSLARSARSVFDADRAIVALGTEDDQVVGLAQRGRWGSARLLDASAARDAGVPVVRPEAREPWREDDWLCAPVLDSQRRSRGVVAARRVASSSFTEEDRELAMLLGQLAATSLEALELNRTIQDNEARLRILVDAAPVGIIESDEAGRVRWWNRSASRVLRWPDFTPDALGRVDWPSEVRGALATFWSDLLAGGLHDTEELTAVIGGRERLLAVSAAVMPSGVGQPNILTLLDDVTDQRELREEVRHAHRMELRGQVASSVAHDFNNLITLILGYSELLSRQLVGDEKSIELVRNIQSTSSRASTLTAQLQSVGRTSQPAPVRLEIGAALSANAEVLERIMGSKNAVVWRLTEQTPAVTIDADLFEQMILNLSINARDAMPGGGTLTFNTEVRDAPFDTDNGAQLTAATYVVLSISDTGVGMDEATKARCFEPLFTTKGPFQGTGLGLTSARRLVEESGGVITCSSTPGVGTTFTIWLPAPPADHVDTNSAVDAAVEVRAPRARIEAQILLVEDDTGLRRLARQVLQRNGFVVHEAVSAEDALEIYRRLSEPVDMLVSDVVLPGMHGPELAVVLQQGQRELLVVMMSGTASPQVIDPLAPGTATFLAKPFKPSELVDGVISLLSRRGVDYVAGSKR